MSFWQAFVEAVTGDWGWLLILSSLSCLGFVGMAVAHFVKVLITKNTTSLSKQFVILLPITNTLLTIYDLVLFFIFFINKAYPESWGMLLPAIINGLISAYGVMILKIKYCRAAKKLGLTEIEYYQKYLKPKAWVNRKKKNKK